MAKARPTKTIPVDAITARINNFLRLDAGANRSDRLTACSILESILMDTGNYKGFQYLLASDLPEGVDPGIIPDYRTGKHVYPDDSRRRYSY